MRAGGSGSAPASCVTCGALLSGPYCAQCGEQAPSVHNYSVAHFIKEALENLLHLDGRIFRTFRSLLTRPGELTAYFLEGRRQPYMGPVHLFLVANVIYFVLQPFSNYVPFTTTLYVQMNEFWWSGLAQRMVAAKLAARRVSLEEYRRVFDQSAHLQGKSLVLLMVPAFALAAWALYRRSRKFYVEHLVFSCHAFALFLVFIGLKTVLDTHLFPWAGRLGLRASSEAVEISTAITAGVPFGLYLYFAARRAYGASRISATWKSAVLVIALLLILTAYRCLLFFTVFYAT